MNNTDLIGIGVILFTGLSALYGLHRLTKPYPTSKEEYAKRLKQSSGIAAGAMNALMYPFEEVMHPQAVEAVHVIKDMRQGCYDTEQESHDGVGGTSGAVSHPTGLERVRSSGRNRSAKANLLRRLLHVFKVRG